MKKSILIICTFLMFYGNSFAAKWLPLPGTDIKSKCPPNNYGGIKYPWASSCGAVVGAWSGAVWDDANRAMYVWGGGHGDYSGNEVYKLDISLSTGVTMTRWKDPDTTFTVPRAWGGDEVCDGCSNPCSRHTYGNMAFIPAASSGLAHDQLWIFGGARAGGSGGFGTDTWMLDLTTKIWTKKNPTGPNPGSVILWAVYNPKNNKVYTINGGSGSNSAFFAYDVATNTWARLRIFTKQLTTGDSSYRNAVIVGDNYYFIGGNGTGIGGLWKINVNGSPDYEYHAVSTTGDKQIEYAMAPGLTYDSKRNLLVAWNGGSSSAGNYTEPAAIYTLNLSTLVWTKTTVTENAPILATPVPHGVFGRFAYSSKMDCYVVIGQAGINAALFCPDDYPTDLWFSRTLSATAWSNPCENGTCKHQGLGITPDGLLWVFGGDHQGSASNNVHKYNISTNEWTTVIPQCAPDGTVQLDGMDEGAVIYNTTNGKFYYFFAANLCYKCRTGASCSAGYTYDPGCAYGTCKNSAMLTQKNLRFDPVTGTWDPTPMASAGLSGGGINVMGAYDPILNKIFRLIGSNLQLIVYIYDITSDSWSHVTYSVATDLRGIISESRIAHDPVNRVIYIWDAARAGIYKYNIATPSVTRINIVGPVRSDANWYQFTPVWDSTNNIVLIPNAEDSSPTPPGGHTPMVFHTYKPDSGSGVWTANLSMNTWNGKRPYGRNAIYNPVYNLLIAFGGVWNVTYATNQMWFYRYGGGAKTKPSADTTSPLTPKTPGKTP